MTIALLLLSTLLFTFSAGINAVSFPLILYQHQVSPVLIGVIEGVEILAGVLIAKFLYGISRKFGVLRVIMVFATIESVMIVILPLYYSFWWWICLVLISGLSWFIIIAQ